MGVHRVSHDVAGSLVQEPPVGERSRDLAHREA